MVRCVDYHGRCPRIRGLFCDLLSILCAPSAGSGISRCASTTRRSPAAFRSSSGRASRRRAFHYDRLVSFTRASSKLFCAFICPSIWQQTLCLLRCRRRDGRLRYLALMSSQPTSPNGKGCSGGEERALRLHPWLNKPGW